MKTPQKCRFKLAWQNYRVGDVIEPNGTLRDWLMGHGYIEVVEEPKEEAKPETPPVIKRRKQAFGVGNSAV